MNIFIFLPAITLIFGLLLVILSALKKRAHHSTGILPKADNSIGKRKLEAQCEEMPSKKQKKCQFTGPAPSRKETHVTVQECTNFHSDHNMEVESPTADAPQAVNLTIGLPEYRYLWNRMRDSFANAKSQEEKIFYGHLKRYVSNQSDQNNGRVLFSDVEKVNDLMDKFETTIKELDNKKNDYDDICLYRGCIKGLIGEAEEKLPLPE